MQRGVADGTVSERVLAQEQHFQSALFCVNGAFCCTAKGISRFPGLIIQFISWKLKLLYSLFSNDIWNLSIIQAFTFPWKVEDDWLFNVIVLKIEYTELWHSIAFLFIVVSIPEGNTQFSSDYLLKITNLNDWFHDPLFFIWQRSFTEIKYKQDVLWLQASTHSSVDTSHE